MRGRRSADVRRSKGFGARVEGLEARGRRGIRSRGKADEISGGAGRDRINSGVGDDQISGGSGNDQIVGGAGVDVLFGQSAIEYAFGKHVEGEDLLEDVLLKG